MGVVIEICIKYPRGPALMTVIGVTGSWFGLSNICPRRKWGNYS